MLDSLETLKGKLSDPALLATDAYVGGHWQAGTDRFDVRNPANRAVIAQVTDCSRAMATEAIAAAAGIDLEVIEGGSHGLGAIVVDGRLADIVRRVACT